MSQIPTAPSTWYSGPLSPQQLNGNLYSFNGSGYGANGILFHAHRTVLHESMSQSALFTVSTAGTWNRFPNTATTAFSILDTGALFGTGCDNPGGYALYQFIPNAVATSGIGYTPGAVTTLSAATAPSAPQGAGGNYLVAHFATGQTAKTTPAAIGAGMYYTPGLIEEDFISTGAIQAQGTAVQGCAPYIDLINAGGAVAAAVSSPVAYQQIASYYLPQGTWNPDWSVQVSATASSSDADNFSLVLGTATIATSSNAGTVGYFAQGAVSAIVTVPAGEYLSITAGAVTPTSAATYGGVLFGQDMPLIGNGNTFQPAGFYADGSATSEQLPANATDTAGFTPRHTWVWASVTNQGTFVTANSNPYTPGGNLAGWYATGGAIAAATPPPGNPPPQPSGVLLTPSGSSTAPTAFAGSAPVTAGTQYQVTSAFFPSGNCTVSTGFAWYSSAGSYLSSSSANYTVFSNAWTAVTCWGTAPVNAVTALPFGGLAGGIIPATLTTYIAGIAVPSGQVPAPQASWSGGITSALMNGPSGPQQALAFLNNPPAMRQGYFTAPTIPNATNTVVTFNPDAPVLELPVIDTYSAYNSAIGAYIAPLPGLYLAFDVFPFAANATGLRYSGFQVTTSSGVTTCQGPAYSAVTATSVPTSAMAVRVLDLNANDEVAPVCYQSSGGSLAITNQNPPGYQPHFGMLYLCPYSSGGVLSFTPPLTSFHWYAGLPAGDLLAYLDEHLGNDLNFLVNRPYFTGYQQTPQTGLTNGSWYAVTIDTPGGLLHGVPGDNYGGWSAASNSYVAQQPGWYLVITEVYASIPSAATGYLSAGINCPSSGGVNPSTGPDQYQTVFFPVDSGTIYPGAFAMGMYYLAGGESVQPMIRASNWGGTWGTAVKTSPKVNSQFTVVWIAELGVIICSLQHWQQEAAI